MFKYVFDKSEASQVGFIEIRLVRIMDYINSAFTQIDFKKRGYFYGWELEDYLRHGPLLKDLAMNDSEICTLLRYSVQIAGLDDDEMDDLSKVKIKHAFFLAQLEQNFYIRF